MENCYYCKKNLPQNLNVKFCPYCTRQLRCKKCDEALLADSIACYSCGSSVIDLTNKPAINEIEFEQKGDTRKFKASFTDVVGHDLVATFGGMVGLPQVKRKFGQNVLGQKSVGNSPTIEFEDAEVIADDEELKEALLRVFKIDDEKLIVQTSNLKEKHKLDKGIRLSLLTLLGYKHIHNSDDIKRKTLTDILNKSKLNSGAFRAWIGKSDEIVKLSGGSIALTPNGNTMAVAVLNEVLDSAITTGSLEFGKVSPNSKKSKTSSSDSTSSKGARTYIDKLIEESFFKEKRTLSEIVLHLKDNHAVTFKTNDISGYMSQLIGKKTLKRDKGVKGYAYFI